MAGKTNIGKYYDEFYRIARNITKGYKNDAQDLVQEFYLSVLEYPDQTKIKDLIENGHIIFWGSRVMVNMYVRERGFFKRKYHRERSGCTADVTAWSQLKIELLEESQATIENKETEEKQYKALEEKLSELHWYDRKIIEVYYGINTQDGKGYSIRGLSKATGISASSLFHTIKKVKKHLKDE